MHCSGRSSKYCSVHLFIVPCLSPCSGAIDTCSCNYNDYRVFIAPPRITAPTENEHIAYTGASFALYCHASGDPVPNMKWLANGVVHSYSSVLQLKKVAKLDEGLYQCFAINSAGVDGRVVKVTVKDPSKTG